MTGIEIFASEQARQRGHGYTETHDDTHLKGELEKGAACYLAVNQLMRSGVPLAQASMAVFSIWPFEPETWKPSEDMRDNIRKAGGMLASEYDRLTRAKLS